MIIKSDFKPATGLGNPHIQTLLPGFLRDKAKISYITQTLELDDGDFIDLVWSEKPARAKPIVLLFHGLEGSINSPYINGIMQAIKHQGWTGLLMHFRGCSGRHNRLPSSYHSGHTEDAKFLLQWLAKEYTDVPLAAAGFSLGGNMLLKLQAELADNSPFKAAVSVCAPLMLSSCASRMENGFSRFYQRHLLNSLKRNILAKSKVHDFKELINFQTQHIRKLTNFKQFDHHITAPLHGFANGADYYARASGRQYIKHITRPTLIIHALDDPFMGNDVLPDKTELPDNIVLELSQYGGHVGFVGGNVWKPEFWLDKRIIEYLSDYL